MKRSTVDVEGQRSQDVFIVHEKNVNMKLRFFYIFVNRSCGLCFFTIKHFFVKMCPEDQFTRPEVSSFFFFRDKVLCVLYRSLRYQ